MSVRARTRVAFVLETQLGHATFIQMLHAAVAGDPAIDATWFYVHPRQPRPGHDAVRGVSNHSVTASVFTRRVLGRLRDVDVAFLHATPTVLLMSSLMTRLPTVVSTDATPVNFDLLASAYSHSTAHPAVETLKRTVTGRPLRRASHLVGWTDWVADSFIRDYGADPARVSVVPPGVPVPPEPLRLIAERDAPLKVLFVGADLERKGGLDLLRALKELDRPWVCHLVTKNGEVEPDPSVVVHRDFHPGDPRLQQLMNESDVLALPTYGDAFGLVLIEAMSAGLPVISTSVGPIPTIVAHERTGLIIEPGNVPMLTQALDRLAADPAARLAMGHAAWQEASTRFDLATNGSKLMSILRDAAPVRPG